MHYNLFSWWNSLEVVSMLGALAQGSVAILGIIVVVLGCRESALREHAQAAERAKLDAVKTQADISTFMHSSH
jgi:hypothetical protein